MTRSQDNSNGMVQHLRREIDFIDVALLRLLNQRAEVASRLGTLKDAFGLTLFDPRRESHILVRLRKINPGPLGTEAVNSIFGCIIHESRRMQEEQAQVSSKSQIGISDQEASHGH